MRVVELQRRLNFQPQQVWYTEIRALVRKQQYWRLEMGTSVFVFQILESSDFLKLWTHRSGPLHIVRYQSPLLLEDDTQALRDNTHSLQCYPYLHFWTLAQDLRLIHNIKRSRSAAPAKGAKRLKPKVLFGQANMYWQELGGWVCVYPQGAGSRQRGRTLGWIRENLSP